MVVLSYFYEPLREARILVQTNNTEVVLYINNKVVTKYQVLLMLGKQALQVDRYPKDWTYCSI